ncbi:BamA/TamA family outer membrane protein [Anabaena subtropica]|uniref:BamA/TamA family outer membrane protein n=1 Tax=Anabaena subtropica FACHB-260 TaxID=2692884 RepID=A0ABR8CQ28_9NOST|nr:BamA/TamA family outer membrane protein [Anabaena subtropica]MBD2343905.1 BamA/TamA family outer membrane protein [Anabaena subtropica FACHB-260]
MRLSPVLVVAVAIAAPLSISLTANAQTSNSLEQTLEAFPSAANQQPEQNVSSESPSDVTVVKGVEHIQSPSVELSSNKSTKSATTATKEIIVPTLETSASTPNFSHRVEKLTQNLTPQPPLLEKGENSKPLSLRKKGLEKDSLNPVKNQVATNTPIQQPNSQSSASPADVRKSKLIAALKIHPQTINHERSAVDGTPSHPQQKNENFSSPIPNTPVIISSQTPTTTAKQLVQAPEPQPDTQPEVAPPTTEQQAPTPAPETTPGTGNFNTPSTNPETTETTEPRVLVSEVLVRPQAGVLTPELETQVYNVIRTQPGRTTTRSQLQEDINAIFGTGFFSNVQAVPEDTPLGVRVSFVVQPNPVLTKVEIQANPGTKVPSVLPPATADEIFRAQYGRILNLRDLQEGIKELTKRYQDQGYVLANVIGAPQVSETGVVTLQVAEGVVENINVRFRNKEGQEVDEQGQPIRGRTRDYIITREVELQPGQVFNRNKVQQDLQRVFGTGLFEDVNVSLDPGTDPTTVNVVVNVVERSSGSIAAGAGISSASGLFGTVSYQQQNLGGRNQKLGAEVQVGERELLFDLRFTDPWIAGDPYRTSYTANIFRRRSISLIFDGKDQDIRTFDPGNETDTNQQDRPRVTRLGGGVTFTRPLSANPFERAEWTASAGLQYQRVSARDADGNLRREGAVFDDNGNRISENVPLSFSGSGEDDLLLLQLGAQRDLRNNPLQPTSGSYLRFGVDQSVPVGSGNIFLTRLRGSYSQYLPVKFTGFARGPETIAFNIQGGTVLGDLPPYEAFSLGGSNSVRGYEEGALGSGRSFVQASVEYRFPVFSVVSGALFLDFGSDLGTGTRTAEVLNKSGSGYGYGLGVRVQSPLGPIRIDYGINDDGDSRINFGIGERF